MPILTLELPEPIYPEVLSFASDRLGAYLASDEGLFGPSGELAASDQGQEVLEGRVLKRTYTGPKAVTDASATLNSINEALTKLVAIAYADESEGLSYEQLAEAMGTSVSTVKAYRMRLGRQAYYYGKRVNPLSHRSTDEGGTAFFMAPETKAAFREALEAVL